MTNVPPVAAEWKLDIYHNPRAADKSAPFPAHLSPVNKAHHQVALDRITSWPGYAPTPLVSLPELAAECGFASIHAKDEGSRFGVGSFKALGAPFAVCEILREVAAARAGRHVTTQEILAGQHRHSTEAVTVATASDGNHGVAVAWAAQTFGCRSVVYMHGGVSEHRAQLIRDQGGVVMRCDGTYDESVRQCCADAARSGWPLVQDVSWEGYEEVPRWIYQGYTVLTAEFIKQLGDVPPTHVLINTGVGGFASSQLGHLWEHFGADRPRFITVEPVLADCLIRSGKAGERTTVPGDLDTIQAGLGCGEVATIAWEILNIGTDDFIAVPDSVVPPTMQLLANCSPPVIAGESAVAGLAVMLAAAKQPEIKEKLGLDENSRIVVVICEGATDPTIYEGCVGRSVHEVNAKKFYSKLSTEASGHGKSLADSATTPFRSTYQNQIATPSKL